MDEQQDNNNGPESSADQEKPPEAIRPKPAVFVRVWHILWRRRLVSFIQRLHKSGTLIFTGGLFIVAGFQTCIYYRQERDMTAALGQNGQSISLNASQVQLALNSFHENKRQFDINLVEIKKQTAAQVASGAAAANAANIAKDTLHISERAYIAIGTPQIYAAKKAIDIPIINSGHIPSGSVDITLYEATLNVDNPVLNGGTPLDDIVERHKSIHHLATVPPIIPVYETVTASQMSADRMNNGTQLIVMVGTISYNDGFINTPTQHYPICIATIFNVISKTSYLAVCDASSQLPKFETLDWGKNTDVPNQ